MACPSHPSVAMVSGSHVCQMYVLRKCDRLESGYPTPCTTAILPSVVHLLERHGVRIERKGIVDGQHLLLGEGEAGPRVVIQRVRVGNDRVHKVVPADQLHDYQYGISLCGCHYGSPFVRTLTMLRTAPPVYPNWNSRVDTIS